jgi:hypothetical protein
MYDMDGLDVWLWRMERYCSTSEENEWITNHQTNI